MGGRVVHFEIPYDEGERARAFYAQVFGWELQPMPEMDYTMAMTGPMTEEGSPTEPGYINGGMLPRKDAAAPAPVIVIGVDDIEKTLAQVEGAGGSTVVPRTPVGDMGFTAYVRDPEGNVVGMWENAAG
jgi:uncharacterized protein